MMKKKFLLLTVLLALTVSGCAVNSNIKSAADSNNKTNATAKDNGTESEIVSEATETELALSEAEALAADAVPWNTESTLGSWSLTITAWESTDYISESDYLGFEPEEGQHFLTFDITAVNTGTQAVSFLPSYGTMNDIISTLYIGEDSLTPTKMLGYSDGVHDKSVEPGESITGKLVFQVPGAAAGTDDAAGTEQPTESLDSEAGTEALTEAPATDEMNQSILLLFEAGDEKVVFRVNE